MSKTMVEAIHGTMERRRTLLGRENHSPSFFTVECRLGSFGDGILALRCGEFLVVLVATAAMAVT